MPVAGRNWWWIGAVLGLLVWVASRQPGYLGWWAAIGVVAVGAVSAWALQRALPSMLPGEANAYVALSLLASAACVPETGRIPAAMTVAVVAAAFALALRGTEPWWVVGPWVLAFAVALAGTAGRPSAVVGVLVAFAAPVVVGLVPAPTRWRVAVAAVSFASAAVMARTGGIVAGSAMRGPVLVALACVGVSWTLAAAAGRWVARSDEATTSG